VARSFLSYRGGGMLLDGADAKGVLF